MRIRPKITSNTGKELLKINNAPSLENISLSLYSQFNSHIELFDNNFNCKSLNKNYFKLFSFEDGMYMAHSCLKIK